MRTAPVGAPLPWPPPSSNAIDNKSFCTSRTCSINCPQWCGSLFLPPPPPFLLDSFDDGNGDSSSHVSPLMAALIAVLAAAFLIIFYYTVASPFCRRRRRIRRTQIHRNPSSVDDAEIRVDPIVQESQDPAQPAASGLDESFIRQITVFKYRRADGLIEGSDCAVCLNEFNEEENLRLMPNCEHAFHIPCIDAWLRSQSSCPLCRATMNPVPARPNSVVSVSAMQVQRSTNVVLAVREVGGEVIVSHEVEGGEDEDGSVDFEEREREETRKGKIHRR